MIGKLPIVTIVILGFAASVRGRARRDPTYSTWFEDETV